MKKIIALFLVSLMVTIPNHTMQAIGKVFQACISHDVQPEDVPAEEITPFPLSELPDDILENIILFTGSKDASELARVNRRFNAIVENLRTRGKLLYPTLTVHSPAKPRNPSVLFEDNDYFPDCLAFKLATHVFVQKNSLYRRLAIFGPTERYLPAELKLFKNIRHLYLSVPFMKNTNRPEEYDSLLIKIITPELYLLMKIKNVLWGSDIGKIISLEKLIEQLPKLEKITWCNLRHQEIHFIGKEQIGVLKNALAKKKQDYLTGAPL